MDLQDNRFQSNKKYFTISVYTVFVFALCALVIKLIFNWSSVTAGWDYLVGVVSPYLIGCFIAYLLNPFVLLLERYILEQRCHIKIRFIRILIALLVTYAVAIGIIVVIIRFIVPEIGNSVTDIVVNKFPGWYAKSMTVLEDYLAAHPYLWNGDSIAQQIEDKLAEYMNISYLSSLASSILPSVWSTSVSVVKWLWNLIIAIIVSVYLLADKSILGSALTKLLYAFVPKERSKKIIATIKDCNKIFGGFIWGKTLDSLIIGILCFVLMSILRMPYAVLISVVVGVTNMIPYLGPYVGCVPGAFILLVSAPDKVIPYLILILIIQQFDGWILGPKILGDFTGLRPVLILFAITLGGAVAGIPGMFLGVPCVAVIQFLVSKWVSKRLADREVTEEEIHHGKKTLALKDIFFKG